MTLQGLESELTGMMFFLFAIFCAYWAQEKGRSAWGWFSGGLFFAPTTGLFLLYYNGKDKEKTPR